MAISQNFPDEGPTLNLNFAGGKVLDPRITFSRSSVGTYMDANGLVVTASADEPRFDHRYVNGEIESLGLLVEEQRTNLYTNNNNPASGTSGTATKTTVQIVLPSGETGPALETDADAFGENYKNITASSNTAPGYLTFYAKKKSTGSTGTLTITMEGGGTTRSFHSGSINSDTWTKISTTHDWSSSNSTGRRFDIYFNGSGNTSDGDTSFYTTFFQFEEGYFPTSYIPTSGSTVTRNHDRAYYENVDQTDWFSKTEGTIVFEHTDVPYHSSDDAHYPAVGFAETTGGGSNPSIQYYVVTNNASGGYLVRYNYPTDSAFVYLSNATSASKVGFVYKEDDYALVRNGSVVGTDSSGAVPAAYMLVLGMNAISNTGNNWNAHLKNLQYYPTRLSNTVLQNLTK